MRTRTWWGKKRPLHYDIFKPVKLGDGAYRATCPHGEGVNTNTPEPHYCLSLDGRPFLQDIGFGVLMHDTPPISWLKHERRSVTRGDG